MKLRGFEIEVVRLHLWKSFNQLNFFINVILSFLSLLSFRWSNNFMLSYKQAKFTLEFYITKQSVYYQCFLTVMKICMLKSQLFW